MIILAYFLTGGIAFYVIGKKTREEARHNRIKFFAYFVIINGVFLSIVIQPVVFRILAGIIVVTGFYELVTLFATPVT